MANFEYAFFDVFSRYNSIPQTLGRKISIQPEYFIELIKKKHRLSPYNETQDSDREKAWKIINYWNVVPGIDEKGCFIEKKFISWINDVQKTADKESITEFTDYEIGAVLIYVPINNNGIPITPVADFLEKTPRALSGYDINLCNSRGFYSPSTEGELKLADKYKSLKIAAKTAGYRRLSEMYESIEKNHIRDAEEYAAESEEYPIQ